MPIRPGSRRSNTSSRSHVKDASGKDTEEFQLDKNCKFIYEDEDSDDDRFGIKKGIGKGDEFHRWDGGGDGVC